MIKSFKLDKRIKDKSDILNVLNCDESCIGAEGYFSSDLAKFTDLNLCHYGVVKDLVYDENESIEDTVFLTVDDDGNYQSWSFFLPKESLDNVPEWSPFSEEEFKEKFKMGEPIIFRRKRFENDCLRDEFEMVYNGFKREMGPTQRLFYVILGNEALTLKELFEKYEYFSYGQWYPFGMLDQMGKWLKFDYKEDYK